MRARLDYCAAILRLAASEADGTTVISSPFSVNLNTDIVQSCNSTLHFDHPKHIPNPASAVTFLRIALYTRSVGSNRHTRSSA